MRDDRGEVTIIERMSRANSLNGLRPRRFDLTLLGTGVGMVLVTVVLAADVNLRIVLIDRTLDVAVTSWSILMAGGLALLTLPRYRDSGRLALLLQVAAFALTAAFGAFAVAAILFRFDDQLGMTRSMPSEMQPPLYVTAMVRFTTALLFLLAGVAAINRLRTGTLRPRTIILAPIVIIVVLTIIVYALRDVLPPMLDTEGMKTLVADNDGSSRLTGFTPLAIGFVVVTFALSAAAALLFRTVYVNRGPVSDGFLAVGLVILAFAELQSAFYPSIYTGLVTASDLIRLLAYGVFLLGIGAEQRSDLRALREAYAALDRLRVTEAERAALEERSRLAREDPRRPRAAPVVREAQVRTTRDDGVRGRQAAGGRGGPGTRLRHRRGAAGARHHAHEPRHGAAAIGDAEPHGRRLRSAVRAQGHLLGRRRPADRAATSAADRGPAHRPGGTHECPQARRRDGGPGPGRHARPRAERGGRRQRQGVRPQRPGGRASASRAWRSAPACWVARSGSPRSRQGGTTVEVTVPMLLPDWLPAVSGSALQTAAEVVEDTRETEPAQTPSPHAGT